MAHLNSQEVALDLSCVPIDLSGKPSWPSISEHIDGVKHFSFLDLIANEATETNNNCGIDVEAWDDSLLNVTSILKLAEIRQDWVTDKESSEDESVPWRFSVVESSEQDIGLCSDTLRESVISEFNDVSASRLGIAESSEFYVFHDPHEKKDLGLEVTVTGAREVGCDEQSTATNSELELLTNIGWSHCEGSDIIGTEDSQQQQPVVDKKRKFDISLLDCWSNDNLEYTNCDRRGRFDATNIFDDNLVNEYDKGAFKYYVILFWPILTSPLPPVIQCDLMMTSPPPPQKIA